MKTHTQRLFEGLIGNWSFSRQISHQGSVTGQASFKQKAKHILGYREEGIWQFHTKKFAVFKEYQYRYDPKEDKISVYFQDTGKLFFAIHFAATDNAAGQHLCSADYYQAFYHFSDENNFSLDFIVKGPKKNYCIKTHFCRLETIINHKKIYGLGLKDKTRCFHYSSPLDIIAILFKCCQQFWACYECHKALANHTALPWSGQDHTVEAILCGSCGNSLTIERYLHCQSTCPHCQASFNPGCKNHHHLYFS